MPHSCRHHPINAESTRKNFKMMVSRSTSVSTAGRATANVVGNACVFVALRVRRIEVTRALLFVLCGKESMGRKTVA